jgi:hypothetical protein
MISPVGSAAVTASRRLVAATLVAAMVLDALTIWTLAPLVWLWIGSRIQGSLEPGMRSYGAILIGMPVTMASLLWVLQGLNRAYERVSGRSTTVRREPRAWLRSLRAERRPRRDLNMAERILIASVVLAVCIDAVWFVLLAHPSPPVG